MSDSAGSPGESSPDAGRLAHLDEGWDRGLAVVAHPDDVEYGAASAVARWTAQGKWIGYVLASRGEAGIDGMDPADAGPLREAEQRTAAASVGVHDVEFLDHPDGHIVYGLDLRRDIAAAIRRWRPEVVFSLNYRLTFGGGGVNMADHRAVGLAVLDAARDAGNRWVFTELLDAGLEPWAGTRRACFAASPHPTHAVDVSQYVEAGIGSLACHRTYLAGLHSDVDPEAFLRENLAAAGEQAGVAAAVTFEVFDL